MNGADVFVALLSDQVENLRDDLHDPAAALSRIRMMQSICHSLADLMLLTAAQEAKA